MSSENDDLSILQLVYTSRSVKPLSDAELSDLLVEARNFNTANAITGVLMCNDDFFAQCLEGPVVETYGLFRRTKEDPRHHSAVLVFDELTEQRVFSEWSMGYTGLSASESIRLELPIGRRLSSTIARQTPPLPVSSCCSRSGTFIKVVFSA